jgi:hypothetical protein
LHSTLVPTCRLSEEEEEGEEEKEEEEKEEEEKEEEEDVLPSASAPEPCRSKRGITPRWQA